MYQPYDDECWMKLAQSIVASAAESYANQFPKFYNSMQEFELADKRSFAPVRKSILYRLCNGPVRVLVDPQTYFDAFERKRFEVMNDFGVPNLK